MRSGRFLCIARLSPNLPVLHQTRQLSKKNSEKKAEEEKSAKLPQLVEDETNKQNFVENKAHQITKDQEKVRLSELSLQELLARPIKRRYTRIWSRNRSR